MNLLAFGWDPELRGLLTVVIGVVMLMGSVYMIMATNMGSRLAFLVALAGFAGWMMLMGATWWIYGIGLRGPDPSWQPVAGATILQDTDALRSGGVLEVLPTVPDDATAVDEAAAVGVGLRNEGFIVLDTASPAFGQAQARSTSLPFGTSRITCSLKRLPTFRLELKLDGLRFRQQSTTLVNANTST
jgi:hypothetical protein